MPKKKPDIINATEINIGENWRKWGRETWYSVFVTMFLQTDNAEIQQYVDNVINAVNDAKAITTIKNRYEKNDRTQRHD